MRVRWNLLLCLRISLFFGVISAGPQVRPLPVAAQDTIVNTSTASPTELEWMSWGATTTSATKEGTYLWLGGQGGAVRYDIATGAFQRFTALDGLTQNRVLAVTGDGQGSLWFGGDTGLTQRTGGGVWHHFSTANSGLASNFVTDLALASDGTLWALHGGAEGDVSRRNADNSWAWRPSRSTAASMDYADVLVTTGTSSLWTVVGGDVWVDYAVYDGVGWQDRTPTPAYITVERPNALVSDSQGTVWALADGNTIMKWDGQAWSEQTIYVPIYGTVDALGLDLQDRVWLGVQGSSNPYVSWSSGVEELMPEMEFNFLPQWEAPPPIVSLVPGAAGVFAVGDGWLRTPDGAIVRFLAQPHFRFLAQAALDTTGRLFMFSTYAMIYANGVVQRMDDRGTKGLADDDWSDIFDGVVVTHMEQGADNDIWVAAYENGRVPWPLAPRRVLGDGSWIEYPLPMDPHPYVGDIFVRDARRVCFVYANSSAIFPPELRSGIYCLDDGGTPDAAGDDSWIDYPGPMGTTGVNAWDAQDRLWYGDQRELRRWDFGWDTIATTHVCELVPVADGTLFSIETGSGDCHTQPTIRILWPNGEWEIDTVGQLMEKHADLVRETNRANHVWSVAPDGGIWYLESAYGVGGPIDALHYRDGDTDTVYAMPSPGMYERGLFADARGRVWLVADEVIWRGSAAPGFALQSYPAQVWVARGGQATGQLGVMRTGEFTGTIALSSTGFPAGLDISLSPILMSGQQLSTVIVDADEVLAPGTYVGSVTGASGDLSASTTLSITIVDRLSQNFLPEIQQP